MSPTRAELAGGVRRLVDTVIGWSPARWVEAPHPVTGADPALATRAAVMTHLIQRIADAEADAQQRRRRNVPALGNDLALIHQLQVVTADLLAADPGTEALAAALAEVVLHRLDLDGGAGHHLRPELRRALRTGRTDAVDVDALRERCSAVSSNDGPRAAG